MKNKLIKVIAVVAMIITTTFCGFVISGCGNNDDKDNQNGLLVYTSFYPIYDFASRVVGDEGVVKNLIPAGQEAHDFEPTTIDIKNMYKADIIIINGFGLEHWVGSLPNELEKKVFVASKNIDAIITSDNATDPHIWLDVNNAITIMENIKNRLCEIDKDSKDVYTQNFETNYAILKGFDMYMEKSIQNAIDAFGNDSIVVSHEAFAYLCKAYGLSQQSITGLSSHEEPSAQDVEKIIKFIKENNVSTIFYEELGSTAIAEKISKETGAVISVLNPIEGLSKEQLETQNYLTIMAQNLNNILDSLSR